MLFFYIRHGDPIYDPDSLTPLGHKQAEALAKRLALFGIDRVFASTSVRAQQTAAPTCELLKKEMVLCDWAHEKYAVEDFAVTREDGKLDWVYREKYHEALFSTKELRNLGNEWYTHPALKKDFKPGIERINREVDALFLSLGYRHDRENARFEAVAPTNERVALFAHQGFSVAFFSSLLDIPYPTFGIHFDIGHTGMSVIDFTEHGGYVYPRVLQLSNDSHLYREGLLTGYQNTIKF